MSSTVFMQFWEVDIVGLICWIFGVTRLHHLLEEPSKTTRSNGFGGGPRLIENNATDTPGPGSYTWDLKSYGPKWLGDIVALVCVEVAFFFADGMWSTTKGSNYPAAKIETSKPFHSHTKSRRLQGSVWRLDERLSIKEAVERTDSWIHFPKISYVMIHDGEFMFPKHDVAIGCFRSAVHRTLQSVWSLPLNCAELGEMPLARCI